MEELDVDPTVQERRSTGVHESAGVDQLYETSGSTGIVSKEEDIGLRSLCVLDPEDSYTPDVWPKP